jgi:hypothetical protein
MLLVTVTGVERGKLRHWARPLAHQISTKGCDEKRVRVKGVGDEI